MKRQISILETINYKLRMYNFIKMSVILEIICVKITASSFKPEIRLCANQPTSERMSQSDERKNYRKSTSIRQAPVFRHLRALRKTPWKFIIWMNELYNYTACCWFPTSNNILLLPITVLTNQV